MSTHYSRRSFLQAAAAAAGTVAFTGCQGEGRHEREAQAQSRVRLAEDILSAYDTWYATVCRQCGAGCGVVARVVEGRLKKLEGNIDHPVNRGKLCARGQAAPQALYHPDRVRTPLRRTGERGAGSFQAIPWDEALDELGARLRDLQAAGRGGEVALLTTALGGHRARLVGEFARALGARWLAFDPLPEAPLREAARRVFGFDRLPDFDIQNSRYVLSFGANFLGTWLSPVHYGVEYGIFRQGSYYPGEFNPGPRPRGYLVQVEPRFSTTAASADEWVPVRPGSEGLLALSLAQVILAEGLVDQRVGESFGGSDAFDGFAPERTAEVVGLPAERIRALAHAFATRGPSLAIGGGPATGQTNGTATASAILALNTLVGAVGRAGGVVPNPPPPIEEMVVEMGASTLPEWSRLGEDLRAGTISAVLLHDANPVYGLPEALGFRDALVGAPFVASFSSFLDDTTLMADLVLPSNLPLEDWGDDVPSPGPGFPVLTVQQPTVRPLHDTRSFWDVLLVLGEEIGGPLREALPWATFRDMVRGGANALARRLRGDVSPVEFERFWVQLLQEGGWWDPAPAPLAPATAPDLRTLAQNFPAPRFAGSAEEYPFHLVVFEHNTLGGGEVAHLPWLQAAPDPVTTVVWRPWVEVNPAVAREMGLREGDLVVVETPQGHAELPAYVLPAARPDVLSIPLGNGHQGFGRWTDRRGANPMTLVAPLVDEPTGALAYAATRARLIPTGRRSLLPKLEGTVPARQLQGAEVVKVTGEST